MTISLVTGGAGFVGRRLVRLLRARGETVRVLDAAGSVAEGDVCGSILDPRVLREAIAGATCVFHLAGNAQLWAPDESEFDRVNRVGAELVLAEARKAGVNRFIHCSSLTTLVGRNTPIGRSTADETLRLDPEDMLGAYPKSKLLAERAVEAAAREGFDALIAVPTEPLGPGDDSLTPPSRLIVDLACGRTPATIDCILSFVDVDSLAEGFIAVRDKGSSGERYLLGGENVSMRQLLASLETIAARKMPGLQLPYAVALGAGVIDTMLVSKISNKAPAAPLTGVRLAGRRVEFSSEKAARELGWRSAPFEDALRKAVDYFRAAGRIP